MEILRFVKWWFRQLDDRELSDADCEKFNRIADILRKIKKP